ncbi:MAG TPA: neutral zinc metallopeptidase [Nocardioidaceae bacterium]|nr:neutral zinc metallopeptidase [Nocardioidaceae bacterium]
MRFNPRARLSSAQVRRAGGGGGGVTRLPIPRGGGGMALPGGIGGILVVVVIFVVMQQLGGGSLPSAPPGQGAVDGTSPVQCRTGADANRSQECRLVGVVNSVQAFWAETLPEADGRRYTAGDTVLFSGQVQTACGGATSASGPFYCPADDTVYLDATFFDSMLEGQLGARGGDFAEAYVVAHEYGHHVQDLRGTMGFVDSRQGRSSDAVRLELQADCFAGMWARYATTVEDDTGQVLISRLTQADIAEALDAASAVGDDRIQQQTQGRVSPETWTHGSARMRMRWFETGREHGSLQACDTFAADRL